MDLLKFVVLLLMFESIDANKSLVMAHLVHRHGARSPIYFFPKNQFVNQWPVNPGMLTKIGMNMTYRLGEFLKKRYIVESGFINESYVPKEVYIRSSDESRCLQSAETELAGLFPPIGYQVWNKDINWQPIPIHSVPFDSDPVLRPDETNCPRLKEILHQLTLKSEYIKKEHDNQNFLKVLSDYTGMKVDFTNIWIVDDVFKCEAAQGFSPPKWYKDIEMQLQDICSWVFLYQYKNADDELGRLLGGALLDSINTNMRNFKTKRSYDELYKLSIFSGHDTSILALAATLDLEITVPTFASCFMIEMYEDNNGNFLVEMHFRNDTSGNIFPFKLKDCDISCPLEQFLRFTSRRTTTKQDCFPHKGFFLTQLQLKIGFLVFMILTLLLMVTLFVIIIRRRKVLNRLKFYNSSLKNSELGQLLAE
ncbi:prostatic acid phosphatase isoform X1 [Hydra vulgaris]|uniref:prostatic acid phosphatase isoform X1 n=1 Tax=Hydra vulgaris TaxID=6087 RepID=UPI001F5E3FFA|nr:prostatic acid phosphatase isoform X1 [Hydra vulgaris]